MIPGKRILFIAEAVTLAHVARPFVLASALDASSYECVLATDPRYQSLFADSKLKTRNLWSIPSSQFLHALAAGKPLYDLETLTRYVEEDAAVIEDTSPDLIVGDFRLSMLVSAARAGIPYVNLVNAYWSPFVDVRYAVPSLPVTRMLGPRIGQLLFNAVRPFAFALHALPMNRLRQRFGQPRLPWDLRHVYTRADFTLYPDVPSLFPSSTLPGNHHFIGPILWSPSARVPTWWDGLPADKPVIYLTLGSSGAADAVSKILAALSGLDLQVIVATAGRIGTTIQSDNVYFADYLPGEAAAQRADLVICNGGSPTTYQALRAGKPVLGVPSNLDQYLNMQGVVRAGAGEQLRADTLSGNDVVATVKKLLNDNRYRQASGEIAAEMTEWDATARFRDFVARI